MVASMKNEGLFIGFESTHQRIDRAVDRAEDLFHLPFYSNRMLTGRIGVVSPAGTAALYIALGIVVIDEDQRAAAMSDRPLDLRCQELSEVRPT
jgi:hypothetical protein